MDELGKKAQSYLEMLCSVKPNRRTGSAGNRAATDFFAGTIRALGYEIDATPFECLDYVHGQSTLTRDGETFEVYGSPYSLGCDLSADLVTVSTPAELEAADCHGKLLLLHGPICAEQLMPKSFVFYNPEHHRHIITLLEQHQPAAIITATARQPDTVGALYPFPLIADGDFNIPSVYCTDVVGAALNALVGEQMHLVIDGQRVPSQATNVIARLNPTAAKKIVVTAHIDAYEDAPGALDNASGTVVLLLLADLLADYGGEHGVEIAAFNGEDHYSAAGQMDYLRRYGGEFEHIGLAINVDGVGYREGRSAYSFYECPPPLKAQIDDVFRRFDSLTPGEPWFNGDHMIFVQSQVPALAITSECVTELMQTVVHTALDTQDMIDYRQLAYVAESLDALVRAL